MEKKSIYKYAAEAGVPAGLYLTLLSACVLLSIEFPALPILVLPLAIGFPFLLWKLLKRIVTEVPAYNKFATVWLGGIYTVIFGTLICMFLSALYITFVEPDFVWKYVSNAIAAVENSTMSGEYANATALMREAMDAHLLPSNFEFLTTMGWLTCFSGSVLSLVLALILNKSGRKVAGQYPA